MIRSTGLKSEETTIKALTPTEHQRDKSCAPTWAGNINAVKINDGVYVDEQSDLLEAWTFDLEHQPELEIEMDTAERTIGDRAEGDGPSQCQ